MTTIKGVRERPILFSGPMVRAIIDGKKTQTRRVFRLPEGWTHDEDDLERIHILLREGVLKWPYGTMGERLWVRETWRRLSRHPSPTMEVPPVVDVGGAVPTYRVQNGIAYRADGAFVWHDHITTVFDASGGEARGAKRHLAVADEPIKWTPSIYMRRHDSRILLDVVDVRVERLNDISEEDAQAEGVDPSPGWPVDGKYQYVEGFRDLWDRINGKRAPWDSNPYVWVVTFKRVEEASHGDL